MSQPRFAWGLAAALALAGPLPASLAQDTPVAQTLFVLTGNLPNDRVGAVVGAAGDLDGDGRPDLVVGTPNLLNVYSGSSTTLLLTLRADRPGDFEGATVHPLPDLNADGKPDFALAAPRADRDNAPDAGAVYFISGATGERLRTHVGASPNAHFGAAVANIGDVTGDNRPELAVGAPGEQGGAGVVALLSSAANNRLVNWRGSAGERFGTAVAALGDLNGDGRPEIAVGAPLASVGRQHSGRVVLFTATTGRLIATPLFGAAVNTQLGASLAYGVDLDGDGRGDLLIGAPTRAGAAGAGAGIVFIYSVARASILQRLEGAAAGDGFGARLAVGGDFDGDGRPDFAVGTPLADVEGRVDAGLVQIYSGATGQSILSRAGSSSGDQLGEALAFVGDVTGDGRADLLVGAPLADVFDVADAGVARLLALPAAATDPGDGGGDGGGGGGGGGL